MEFDFSEEQEQFRDQLRRALARPELGKDAARSVLNGEAAHSAASWQLLADIGVPAIMIDEEHGGLGLGPLELCVAAEEIGRSLAPVPFLSSTVILAEAIRCFGSKEQRRKWLPGLADGSVIGSWAMHEEGGGAFEFSCTTRIADGKLTGRKRPVLDAGIASLLLVGATNADGEFVLAVAEGDDPDLHVEPVGTVDPSRPCGALSFSGAAAEILPGGGLAGWRDLLRQAAILSAFSQLGMADSALAMARAYVLERHAFGRKIGSYQAIKHKLADIYARNELARAHCYYGAWALHTGARELRLAAAGARCSATDAATFAAQENMQVHGGISFTWEADCHLYYRRARQDALLLGPVQEWQDLLVDELAT
ncbi:acyl-CoA dehydrogenase family protein [Sphingopyxis kveilinensis]|uniref:acyl-CoA dehydrogenase family protein n=1 Tax=Sphingopyxis kveilinensis TaxID=3114367 RepID=UPI0030CC8FA9